MLTIWGRENSNNVRKVLWCAAELGLSYTHINAGGAFGKVNEESYRALNPNGLVPLLQDDDFVLWESNTIVRYLAAKFGDATFYPQDLQRAPPPRNGWTGPPRPSFRPSPSSLGPDPHRARAARHGENRSGDRHAGKTLRRH